MCEALNKLSGCELSYSAGLLVLEEKHPHQIRYRSPEPILTTELPKEREGTVPNVVFPTAIDRRNDLDLPGRFDVYYGMADKRIGVARLDLPADLPADTGPGYLEGFHKLRSSTRNHPGEGNRGPLKITPLPPTHEA